MVMVGAALDHRAIDVVVVIVMVLIERKARRNVLAEQFEIAGITANRVGRAGATQMGVDTNDAIRGGHHMVQIVRNHKNAACVLIPDGPDHLVQRRLTVDVNRLGGFVED